MKDMIKEQSGSVNPDPFRSLRLLERQVQAQAPLFDRLHRYAQTHATPFHTPGHKQGQGIPQEVITWWGKSVFTADLTELEGLDNLHHPEDVIADAQDLAAQAYGSEHTWFLVNGSTSGVMAMILAVCQPGDRLLITRQCHRSVISGLILADVTPIYLYPTYSVTWDLYYPIHAAQVKQVLAENPDVKGILLTYPTYQGLCTHLQELASLAHAHGIPLLVDEAHGPHFAFHPQLPISALAAGADLVVQSTHKVLSALTQAAMLHAQGSRVDPKRIQQSLALLQSSSPSYLLMASLDWARRQMALQGSQYLEQIITLSQSLRSRIRDIDQIQCLSIDAKDPDKGFYDLDPTRLTIKADTLGWTGFALETYLSETFRIQAEMATWIHVVLILSIGNTDQDAEKVIRVLQHLPPDPLKPCVTPIDLNLTDPILALSPRQAFFAQKKSILLSSSQNQICAESVAPYPPGIPVLTPGEVITQEIIDYLMWVKNMGGSIHGLQKQQEALWITVVEGSDPP